MNDRPLTTGEKAPARRAYRKPEVTTLDSEALLAATGPVQGYRGTVSGGGGDLWDD